MPTIEFYGFSKERELFLIEYIKEKTQACSFYSDIVYVTHQFSHVRVIDHDEKEKPFVRVLSRSEQKAYEICNLIKHLEDVETLKINFYPREQDPQHPFQNFEKRLIDKIQPIRFHVLATAIYYLFNTKIYHFIEKNDFCSLKNLAQGLDLNETFLKAFLLYLRNEELLIYDIEQDKISLSPQGQELKEFEPWYVMLVGGYSLTFNQIGEVLTKKIKYASRAADLVGIGSCGISQYDAIPLTKKLMTYIPEECTRLLDLGCGNALYLVEFCKKYPQFYAYGAEPDPKSCDAAKQLIAAEGMTDRIKILCTTAEGFFHSNSDYKPDLIILGFILQEILGQSGEEAVTDFLKDIIKNYPLINIIVIEVDNLFHELQTMKHPLAQAYYNPYYLIHYLTPQKLERKEYWQKLFVRCGLKIIREETVSSEVDSTQFEMGFLLKKA